MCPESWVMASRQGAPCVHNSFTPTVATPAQPVAAAAVPTAILLPSGGVGLPRQQLPRRWESFVFVAKVTVLRLRRAALNAWSGPRRLPSLALADGASIAAESRTALWSDSRAGEQHHQFGKVQNLRRAVRALDGVAIEAGEVFSFWRQVGWPGRPRGFVAGRMLQQGCMVPATGGGLCQLSNALYDAALTAGCTIVERHAHSRVVPGSAAVHGRDATVAWNYVDLRFRSDRALRLAVHLTDDELILRLHGQPAAREVVTGPTAPPARAAANSCGSCGQIPCFRHERVAPPLASGIAFLVDEAWPEFVAWVMARRDGGDNADLAMPGSLRRRGAAAWSAAGFRRLDTAPIAALVRGLAIRLAAPGAAKRRAELGGTALVARRLGRLLSPAVTHLWVAQSYLPHLWRAGQLGGRRFSVLMTRPPMQALHDTLDAAAAAYPHRTTLADFRAAPELAAWEAAALARAEMIVTPHPAVAALFPGRAVLLPWDVPSVPARAHGAARPRRIAFPGPTLARKGAYEVRDAARALDLEVLLLGAELEGPAFWDGVRTLRPGAGDARYGWLSKVAAVVQPALVQERPRQLLAARAAGIPMIATAACGLDGDGVTIVPPLDAQTLTERLKAIL